MSIGAHDPSGRRKFTRPVNTCVVLVPSELTYVRERSSRRAGNSRLVFASNPFTGAAFGASATAVTEPPCDRTTGRGTGRAGGNAPFGTSRARTGPTRRDRALLPRIKADTGTSVADDGARCGRFAALRHTCAGA